GAPRREVSTHPADQVAGQAVPAVAATREGNAVTAIDVGHKLRELRDYVQSGQNLDGPALQAVLQENWLAQPLLHGAAWAAVNHWIQVRGPVTKPPPACCPGRKCG